MDQVNPNEVFASIMKSIIETAAMDGKISRDEERLVASMHYDLQWLRRALQLALRDGVITDREQEIINRIIDRIIDNAVEVANLDGVITKEEMNILLALVVKAKLPSN